MQVHFGILIGQERKGQATKIIQIDFAPVIGMHYHDLTWKDTRGMKITHVLIENMPDEQPYLHVQLEPDASEELQILKETYERHGWKVL